MAGTAVPMTVCTLSFLPTMFLMMAGMWNMSLLLRHPFNWCVTDRLIISASPAREPSLSIITPIII